MRVVIQPSIMSAGRLTARTGRPANEHEIGLERRGTCPDQHPRRGARILRSNHDDLHDTRPSVNDELDGRHRTSCIPVRTIYPARPARLAAPRARARGAQSEIDSALRCVFWASSPHVYLAAMLRSTTHGPCAHAGAQQAAGLHTRATDPENRRPLVLAITASPCPVPLRLPPSLRLAALGQQSTRTLARQVHDRR